MLVVLHVIIVILLFGLTVFVHELGHFLLARRLGLVVDVFSIGFGPAIWKRKFRDVTYKIGCLPLGGYVALPQLDPGGHEDAAERQLPEVAPWKKIIVALAGAVFNVLLAVVLAYVVFYGGKNLVVEEHDCVIGFVATNSIAYDSGLRAGDIILGVNGKPINRWDQFMIEGALNDHVELTLAQQGGTTNTLVLPTKSHEMGVRLVDGVTKQMPCLIIGIMPDSSAEQAGLRAGDIIRSFNGEPIYSVPQLNEIVGQRQDMETPMVITRLGKDETIMLAPRYNELAKRALIGVEFNPFDIYKKPKDQLIGWASPVFRFLKALVTPKEARHAASSAGGPLAIFNMIWKAVQTSLLLALWLTGMLNVNLAILNLLPIPVLDGGHIVFSLVEMITRRKVPPKMVAWLSTFFMILLMVLFLLLTVNDIRRLIIPRFMRSATNDTEEVQGKEPPAPEAAGKESKE